MPSNSFNKILRMQGKFVYDTFILPLNLYICCSEKNTRCDCASFSYTFSYLSLWSEYIYGIVHESDPLARGSNDRARTASSPVTDSMPFVNCKSAVVQTVIFFKISQGMLLQAWKDKGKNISSFGSNTACIFLLWQGMGQDKVYVKQWMFTKLTSPLKSLWCLELWKLPSFLKSTSYSKWRNCSDQKKSDFCRQNYTSEMPELQNYPFANKNI